LSFYFIFRLMFFRRRNYQRRAFKLLTRRSNIDRVRTDLEKSWKNVVFFKKSWKTQGILKFGKVSGNYHGISQNNNGIPNKYPWIILFAEYCSLKIKMNYLTLYVYVIRHWRSKSGISSVTPSYAVIFSQVKFFQG